MVMGSSLRELTLHFIFFGIFGFSLNMERWKENPKWMGGQRRLDRQPWV